MQYNSIHERSTMITTDTKSYTNSFAEDVQAGLTDSPKHLPCLYFYDYKGSLLFEKICQLPEYYLTRAETEILINHAEDIISHLSENIQLVELGSGSSIKTELIIEELLNQHDNVTYCPIDISQKMLKESSLSLLKKYDNLEITSAAAEYHEGLRHLNKHINRPKLIIWLGSSIGNFKKQEAIQFLQKTQTNVTRDDFLLIGFDLDKDKKVLENAYNDSQNVTAEFNLNLLSRINNELGGEFELSNFKHEAVYNEKQHRVEMYLVSKKDQHVYIADLKKNYQFKKGERIHTENSHKYSLEEIDHLAKEAGLSIIKNWFDANRYFNLTLFRPN